ncbi:MAG: iron donor protein CyaY [Bdellovibrionales bacterium RIFOXYD1_FULL_53_11]|nr:MAG: iron donor protein CyaY [Bdellovibrionales bacterium RIFOXYD1_FULL_53_11]
MDESGYRARLHGVFSRIERAFDDVDPDVAECSVSAGTMTIAFAGGGRVVLSPQPSLRQIWAAVSTRLTGYHFAYYEEENLWRDAKGTGIELFELVREVVLEAAGINLKIQSALTTLK